jgi:putative hydrolase of the HAD superfamily
MEAQFLLIDADDTLWENNVYFERAFDEFVDFLDHSRLSPDEVRETLDEIELDNVARHGYGSQSFGRNLLECFERLAERTYADRDLDSVVEIAERIMHHPIDVIAGVRDTLEYLTGRHHLTLFTKGHTEEQLLKFERSALGLYFHGVEVVREKDAAAYRSIVERTEMTPERTWMVGNSPKSDIHPALEAGLRAVFVPHERTWSLEIMDLPEPSERFRMVERFSDLSRLF